METIVEFNPVTGHSFHMKFFTKVQLPVFDVNISVMEKLHNNRK